MRAGVVFIALLALAIPVTGQTRNGQLTGTVIDQKTGAPLSSVQVYLQGTSRGVLTSVQGTFALPDIPPGTYTLVAQRIGHQTARRTDVTIGAGATVTLNIAMVPAVLQLQEIVATGLIDPVEGVRSPISVTRVSREAMPVVAAGNAIQNLQGRVAGVTINRQSGQPGTDQTSIMLRTPTSLRGSGFPLIVVDGVILGGIVADPSTTAIEGMDIESVEIIRGAAAASLYGSRAAAGVISITTRRGRDIAVGRPVLSVRSEYGFSEAARIDDLPRHHHFLMNETGTSYINASGRDTTRAGRTAGTTNDRLWFMDKPYPGPVYDNISAVLRPGAFQAHNIMIAQNTPSTNFAASLSRSAEKGALAGNDGYYRNSFRLNLDHRFHETLSLGISSSHTRDGRHNIAIGNDATTDGFAGQDLFTQLLQAPRDVSFRSTDEDGNYVREPDPDIDFVNPLWAQATRESNTLGNRTLINTALTWTPFSWLNAGGDVSYDRREQMTRNYVPKGVPGQAEGRDGSLAFNGAWTDTWNASGQVSLRRSFGRHDARVTFRGLMERDRSEFGNRTGYNFILIGIPHLSNTAPESQRSTSSERELRAVGYLMDTGFGLFDGRYNFTILGRRDGSSLFGPDARWRNYYRVAGAWRIAEEPWFDIGGIDELKLSLARGTAGGRPAWAAQYETWSLEQGLPRKDQLGNRELRPEHTTENEVSINAIIRNRFGIVLTHAWQTTRDQIVPAAIPGYIGYVSQWVNSGAVSGRTTEFSIEAQLLQRSNFTWTGHFFADYSRAKITEWTLPCNATRTWRFDCQGEPVYGIYGFRLLTSHAQLANHRGGEAVSYADQFQVNDEGYLVWVGDKNYTDGIVNGVVQEGTWGTTSPLIGTRTYEWGIPFFEQDEPGSTRRPALGEGSPVNLGWTHSVRYGNFRFHAHLHSALGGVANNRAFQDMINTSGNFPRMDQSGKPDGLKKPVGYYRAAVGSGGSTYITERADYLKLRSLAVNYRLGEQQLKWLGLRGLGMQSLELGIIGRNIFTVTAFDGWDPEQALNLNDRLNAVGTATYPATRTWTAEVTVTF